MALQIRYIKNPIKKYTFLLLASAILGVSLLSIDLGFFQLSIYRILILLSPFFYIYVSRETKYNLRTGTNYLYFLFLLFWLVYSIITLFWVRDSIGWIRIFSFLLCGCITSWFIGWYFSRKEDWVNALKIIELCAFVIGSLGVYEIFSGNYRFISNENANYYENISALDSTIGVRIPTGIFANPNDFALFLLFAIFGSIALYKVKSTFRGRLLSLILVIFFIFLLITTQSRSGFIGFLVSIITMTYLYLKRCSLKKRLLFIIISLIILFTISSWITANKEFYKALITIDTSTGSDQIRINLIKNGLIFLVNSLFMGVGLGNIEYYMTLNNSYFTNQMTDMHNWWMEILVSSGVFIFVFYIVIYTKSLLRLYQTSLVKKDKDIMNLSTCFFCFFIAFLIGATGSSSLMIAEWFWPIMAVVMSFVNSGSKPILNM